MTSPSPAEPVWLTVDCPDGQDWRECRNADCGPRIDGRGCLIEPPELNRED
jgi:hypothetical protein